MSMPKLIMTKGLPASGKSTWAKDMVHTAGYKRINKDDLRAMLDDSAWSRENEKAILDIRDMLVTYELKNGKNVIVDDTNFAPIHEMRLRQLAEQNKAEFSIQDFSDVPLEVCIDRDLKRINSVGEKVIKEMHQKYLAKKPPQRAWDDSKPEVILCDVDGTLALFGDKNPFKRDFENDEINTPVLETLKALSDARSSLVFILSGRSDEYREVTEAWLKENGVPYDALYMRAKGDIRKDSIVKKEIFDKYVDLFYNVYLVLDDRNQVVELWRSLGIPCFQVAPGDF